MDRATTLCGPSELIDVIATERGIAINPRRTDLLDAVRGSDLPILGWDIAITPEGPMVIEANCGPKIGSIQAKSLSPLAQSRYADLYWAWEADKLNNKG